jgi:hypothetical protein
MNEICISFFGILSLAFVSFAGSAVAQSAAPLSTATFSYPPTETLSADDRVLINVKDTLQVEWASNYDEAFLYLFCHGMKDGEMYASECSSTKTPVLLLVNTLTTLRVGKTCQYVRKLPVLSRKGSHARGSGGHQDAQLDDVCVMSLRSLLLGEPSRRRNQQRGERP